jgi:hypothetical protein
MMIIQRMKLTGAAILVSRGMKVLQAAPAACPYRSGGDEQTMKAVHILILAAVTCVVGPCALAAQSADAKPLLERSEDMEAALSAYGFEEVRVFTWRNGLLKGQITFLDGQKLKPADLSAVVLAVAKKLLAEGEALDPKVFSGVLVIAINKPAGKPGKRRPCRVSVAVRKTVGRTMTRAKAKFEGIVPEEGEFGIYSLLEVGGVAYAASERFTPKGGKEFKLYELNLSAKSRGAEQGKKGK